MAELHESLSRTIGHYKALIERGGVSADAGTLLQADLAVLAGTRARLTVVAHEAEATRDRFRRHQAKVAAKIAFAVCDEAGQTRH
jgi:hypothetical protein